MAVSLWNKEILYTLAYNIIIRFETFRNVSLFLSASITTSLEKFIWICVRAVCVLCMRVSVVVTYVIFKKKKKKMKVLLPVEYRNIPCVF